MKNEMKSCPDAFISTAEFYPALMLVLCAFFKTVSVVSTDVASTVLYLNEPTGHFPQILIATAVSVMIVWRLLIAFNDKSTSLPALFFFIAGGVSILSSAVFLGFYRKTGNVPTFFNDFFMVWKEGFRVLAETAFWLAAIRFGVFNRRNRLLAVTLLFQTLAVTGAGLFLYAFSGHLKAEAILSVLFKISGDIGYAAFSRTIGEYLHYILLWTGAFAIIAGALLKKLNKGNFLSVSIGKAFNGNRDRNVSNKKLPVCFFAFSAMFFFASGLFLYVLFSKAPEYFQSPLFILKGYIGSCFLFPFAVFLSRVFGHVAAKCAFWLVCLSAYAFIFKNFYLLLLVVFPWGLYVKEAFLQTVPQGIFPDNGVNVTIWRKSVAEPVALALSGLFLLIVCNRIPEKEIFVTMTASLGIALIALIALYHTYNKAVMDMIETHSWQSGRLILSGKAVRYLTSLLNGTESQNVLYALKIIKASSSSVFPLYLEKALHHKNADVRLYALNTIEELKISSVLAEIVALTEKDEDPAVRQAAVRVMCRLGGTEEREKALSLIDDPVLRQGALTGLLAVGREGVFTAVKNVADLSVSENKKERLMAANALGDAGNRAFCQPLTALLNDSDTDVCKAALKAAGKLTEPALLPAVMQAFRRSETTEDAADALLQFKETALASFDGFLLSADNPVELRIRLIRLVSRIASPAAEAFLFNHLQIEDRRIRFNIIEALTSAGCKATGKDVNTVRLCLYDEMEQATGFLAAIETFSQNKKEELKVSSSLLIEALTKEIDFIKERILLFLTLLYPPKELKETDAGKGTVDIVKSIPSEELKSLCLPLFEDIPLSQRLALLRPQFYPPVLTCSGYVREILETPAGETAAWTRTCAAYMAGGMNDTVFVNALTALLSDPDTAVREAAVWAIGKILPKEEADRLTEEHPSLSDDRQ